MVTTIHDVTLAHFFALGGPLAWKDRPERPGFTFFQAGTEISLIPMGARVNLGVTSGREQEGRGGVAPVEGQENEKQAISFQLSAISLELGGGGVGFQRGCTESSEDHR